MNEEYKFDGVNTNEKHYVESIAEFIFLCSFLPNDEVGISFNGEVEIDDKVSVVTSKDIVLKDADTAVNTYQKVMEIRELTEAERLHISKWKIVIKKLFEVFFNKEKFRIYFTAFWSLCTITNLISDNYLSAMIYIAAIALYNKPIKFTKEILKMLNSSEKVEQLKKEIENTDVLSYINSTLEDEGIKLYIKAKPLNM